MIGESRTVVEGVLGRPDVDAMALLGKYDATDPEWKYMIEYTWYYHELGLVIEFTCADKAHVVRAWNAVLDGELSESIRLARLADEDAR